MRRTNAEFYLAQMYFNSGQKAKALTHYENVTKSGSNEYGEQSLTRVCQILLEAGSYLKPNLISKTSNEPLLSHRTKLMHKAT